MILRFGTLVVLAVVVTAWIFVHLATVLPDPQRDAVDVCQQRTGYQVLPSASGVTGSKGAAFTACLSGTYRAMALSLIGGLLLLALVTAIWYAAQPRWRIRRRRLVRVDALPGAAALRAELAVLVGQTGLRNAPLFLVEPAARRAGGLAFGGWRLRAVCLDAGLIAVRTRDPDRFRAVVLHELAHLRNRDVSTTYLTVALWRAFLLVGALPFAVVVLEPWLVDLAGAHPSIWLAALRGVPPFLATTVPIVAMTVGALIARDAVLRSRELHADARTADWLGSQDPARVLPGLGKGRFAGRWRTHPRPAQRRRAVAQRWLAQRPGFWECFAVVLALQLTGTYLEYAAAEYIGQTAVGVAVSQIDGDVQAVLIGLLLMVSCWRAAGVRRGFVRSAAGVAVGLASWPVLEPVQQLSTGQRTLIIWPTVGSAVAVLVVAVLVAGLTGLLGWCAIRLRQSVASSRHVLVVGVAALVVCWGVLRWWSFLLVGAEFQGFALMNGATRDLLHGYAAHAPGSATLLIVLLAPLLTVQVVCSYTIAGGLIPMVALSAWLPAALVSPRSMTAALRTGAVIGVAGVALLVAERVALAFLVPPAIRHTDGFAVVTAAWSVVVVLLVQVLTAAICGRRARNPWSAALAASSLAATLGLAALWLLARFAPWPGTTFDPLPFLAIYFIGSVGVALSVLAVAAGRIPVARPVLHGRTRFAAVGTAAALSVCLLLLWFLRPSPSQQIVLVRTNPVAVPQVSHERKAVDIWLGAGGSREFIRLDQTVTDLVTLDQRTPVPVQEIVTACRAGLSVFEAASSYPPPPGSPAHDWHLFVATGTADLNQCVADNGATIGPLLTSLAPLGLAAGHDVLTVH
ncbi:MAG TPA: M48 family metalloprotease [Pseudonocardiaceae bacterium]